MADTSFLGHPHTLYADKINLWMRFQRRVPSGYHAAKSLDLLLRHFFPNGGNSNTFLQHMTIVQKVQYFHHFLFKHDAKEPWDAIILDHIDVVYSYLTARKAVTDVKGLPPSPQSPRIMLYKGDITDLDGATVIINPIRGHDFTPSAHPNNRDIEHLIHVAAGPRLASDLTQASRIVEDDDPDFVLTRGYWAAPFILTVRFPVPNYPQDPARGVQMARSKLLAVYEAIYSLCERLPCTKSGVTVVLPPTPTFGWPRDNKGRDTAILTTVFRTANTYLVKRPDSRIKRVVICVNNDVDRTVFSNIMRRTSSVGNTSDGEDYSGHTDPPISPGIATAVEMLHQADNILISAGQGIALSAGLDYTLHSILARAHPAFRHRVYKRHNIDSVFWKGFPGWAEERDLDFSEDDGSVQTDPDATPRPRLPFDLELRDWWVAAKYVYDYLAGYTNTDPRLAVYDNLKHMLDVKPWRQNRADDPHLRWFVRTTNSDRLFHRFGFAPRVVSVHGNVRYMLCQNPGCGDDVWDMDHFFRGRLEPEMRPGWDSYVPEDGKPVPAWVQPITENNALHPDIPLPECPKCHGQLFHFNIHPYYHKRHSRDEMLDEWIADVARRKETLVILEIGSGWGSREQLASQSDWMVTCGTAAGLIRIGTEDAGEVRWRWTDAHKTKGVRAVGLQGDASVVVAQIVSRLRARWGLQGERVYEPRVHLDTGKDAQGRYIQSPFSPSIPGVGFVGDPRRVRFIDEIKKLRPEGQSDIQMQQDDLRLQAMTIEQLETELLDAQMAKQTSRELRTRMQKRKRARGGDGADKKQKTAKKRG